MRRAQAIRLAALTLILATMPLASVSAQTAKPAPGSAAPAATWVFGEHPLWGVSAHVTAGQHAVGLRCLAQKGGQGPVVAVAFTPGLVQVSPGGTFVNYKLVGARGEGGYRVERKGQYFEGEGTTCGVSLHEMQKAKTLVLDDGAEKPKVLGRIPLTGLKAAVSKLLAACPAMKRDYEGCGD